MDWWEIHRTTMWILRKPSRRWNCEFIQNQKIIQWFQLTPENFDQINYHNPQRKSQIVTWIVFHHFSSFFGFKILMKNQNEIKSDTCNKQKGNEYWVFSLLFSYNRQTPPWLDQHQIHFTIEYQAKISLFPQSRFLFDFSISNFLPSKILGHLSET